jgi:hypothetical protein
VVEVVELVVIVAEVPVLVGVVVEEVVVVLACVLVVETVVTELVLDVEGLVDIEVAAYIPSDGAALHVETSNPFVN